MTVNLLKREICYPFFWKDSTLYASAIIYIITTGVVSNSANSLKKIQIYVSAEFTPRDVFFKIGIAFYLYEHQKVKKIKIERQEDGSLIVTLRPAFEHEVIRWGLGESGSIEVLYPPELRKKVAAAGKKIMEKNG